MKLNMVFRSGVKSNKLAPLSPIPYILAFIFQPQAALPVAERVAKTVFCLPLYDNLSNKSI